LTDVRAKEFFTPASTLKTLTTAAAISLLPSNYAPETILHLEGSLKGKTFAGFVRVQGMGDPNISGRFYSSPFFLLHAMADSLRAAVLIPCAGKSLRIRPITKGHGNRNTGAETTSIPGMEQKFPLWLLMTTAFLLH
jgi:hypothetical protein